MRGHEVTRVAKCRGAEENADGRRAERTEVDALGHLAASHREEHCAASILTRLHVHAHIRFIRNMHIINIVYCINIVYYKLLIKRFS